ncbi:hypothetical protein RB597_007548 [Gaeumannomyces tritici]
MRASLATIALSAVALLLPVGGSAREIPENIKQLKAAIIAKGDCQKKLASGFRVTEGNPTTGAYCGDMLDKYGIIYQQMPGGQLSDMDVDCDGQQANRTGDDGSCGLSTDTQPQTSFRSNVRANGAAAAIGVQDLNPFIHSYVVFGNTNEGKPSWPSFDPQDRGRRKLLGGQRVEPLSVMAVVCGDNLFYGLWGDENGPDGRYPMIGEAGIGLARACFGGAATIDGGHGWSNTDVLYLAFTGSDAVPDAGRQPRWDATNFADFERSLAPVGDALVSRVEKSAAGRPACPPSFLRLPGIIHSTLVAALPLAAQPTSYRAMRQRPSR